MKEQLLFSPGHMGGTWHYRARRVIAPHYHADLEFNVVLRGTARYIVKNTRHDLQPGSMIWLFPRQEHVLLDMSRDYEMLIVVARPKLIRQIARTDEASVLRQLDPAGTFVKTLGPGALHDFQTRFRDVAANSAHVDLYNAGLAHLVLAGWYAFLKAGEAPASNLHPSVEKAARLMQTTEAAMSLDQLAETVGLSPSRLSRLFHAQTGVSLVAFRQRQQLGRFFSIYPGNGQHKMLDAALRAGFGSYPQFHRVFVKLIGQSPASYFRRDGSRSSEKTL